MKISKLALIALLGSALMAFGCSDDSSQPGTGGSGATGGAGGMGGGAGGTGGQPPLACFDDGTSCSNGEIDPITPCCTPDSPPDQADACNGDESLENPASCTATGTEVLHQLTVLSILGDCNAGYDLDSCDGSSCGKGGLAPGEGEGGVDNALAGLAPTLQGVGGNLGGVNQAFADAICGLEDGDDQTDGCQPTEIPMLDIQFNVDANTAENCATVDLISGGTELGTVILNISDPTEAGTVCASGTIGTIPLEVGGQTGALGNAVIRMTVSGDGFTDGVLGATVDSATAVAIAEALLEGAGAVVSQVFDIDDELVGDNSAACDALSGTYSIAGAAVVTQ